MSTEKRIENILEKIEFVNSNKTKYKNPELIIKGLETLVDIL
jgi:hypothetical protein